MSFFHAAQGITKAVGGVVVTLSGESIFDIDAGARLYRASLLINTDGTLDKRQDTIISQVDASTDWIIPNGSAPGTYQFRFVNRTGDSPNGTTNMTEDVWVAISGGQLVIERQRLLLATENDVTNFDLEVREGAGSVIDTANFSLDIERII